MKAVQVKYKIWKRKQIKTQLIQFRSFIFSKASCLPKNFHGRLRCIRVFSMDGNYGLMVSLRGRTLLRHMINLNQLESEKIVVNYKGLWDYGTKVKSRVKCIIRLRDCGTMGLWDYGTVGLWDCGTMGLWTMWLWDYEWNAFFPN